MGLWGEVGRSQRGYSGYVGRLARCLWPENLWSISLTVWSYWEVTLIWHLLWLRWRTELHGLGLLVLSPLFVSSCFGGFFFLQALVIPPVGWGRNSFPARECKMMGKLVVYLNLTFSGVETVNPGAIFHWCLENWVRVVTEKSVSLIVCSEFFHFCVEILGIVSASY